MNEHLEDRLARVLTERAQGIEGAPAYRLVQDDFAFRARPVGPGRRTSRQIAWSLIASAGAVAALAALVVALMGGGIRSRRTAPSIDGATCVLTHSARFAAALRQGLLPAGARVLSGGADGTALVSIERAGATSAVELLSPDGTPTLLWQARAGERVRAVANPSGAVSPDASVFVLDRLAPGTPPRLVLTMRPRDVPVVVDAPGAGYRFSTDPLTAPIIVSDGIVQALLTSTANPAQQEVESFWLPTRLWSSTARASNATQLLSVGGNVVLLSSDRHGAVSDIRFDVAQYRPTTLLPALRNGFSVSSDGTTMSWLSRQDGRPALVQWSPGEPAPIRRLLPPDLAPASAVGRFAVVTSGAARGIVDTREGQIVQLPAGVDLLEVNGPLAVVARQTPTGLRYSRVPVTALTNC